MVPASGQFASLRERRDHQFASFFANAENTAVDVAAGAAAVAAGAAVDDHCCYGSSAFLMSAWLRMTPLALQ